VVDSIKLSLSDCAGLEGQPYGDGHAAQKIAQHFNYEMRGFICVF